MSLDAYQTKNIPRQYPGRKEKSSNIFLLSLDDREHHMNYSIGICDDQIVQIQLASAYIQQIADNAQVPITITPFCNSAHLFAHLAEHPLDILFLDIDLGEESGITVAQHLVKEYPDLILIFLTGHREFASEAYDVDALGYVTKPVREEKIERTLHKAFTHAYGVKSQVMTPHLVITEENIKKRIPLSDILYIERVKPKTLIHTQIRVYQVYEPLSAIYERLDDQFIQVNQSEVVNKAEIYAVQGNTVILRDGRNLSIGRTFKKNFKI